VLLREELLCAAAELQAQHARDLGRDRLLHGEEIGARDLIAIAPEV
jgi:hypothetical protein